MKQSAWLWFVMQWWAFHFPRVISGTDAYLSIVKPSQYFEWWWLRNSG